MTQSVSRQPQTPQESLRDLLSRLYREIGISAVAAALEVTSKRDSNVEAGEPRTGSGEKRGKDIAA